MRTLFERAALAAGLIVAGVGQAYADNPSGGFQEQRFGPWRVGVTMSGLNQACVMLQRGTGNSKLAVLRQPRKTAEMALIGPPGSFTEDATVEALVLIDGEKLWSSRIQYVSPQIISFYGFLDRRTGDGRGLLEASQTMTVTFGAFNAKLDLRQSDEALQALAECGDVLEAEESAKARARANTPPSESEVAETRQDLSNAMRGMTDGQPLVAQFQCAITTRDLTGLPDFGGRDPANAVTIGVSEDSSGFINGTTMASTQVERGDGGELTGTAFAFQDVSRAIAGGASPFPQMGTFTAEENAALQALPGIMNDMLGTVMGDRRRFMVVSLQQNNVVFFDLTPSGETATLTAPECVRTL